MKKFKKSTKKHKKPLVINNLTDVELLTFLVTDDKKVIKDLFEKEQGTDKK